MLSLDKFDRATLEEAKKVIAGTSHWFVFDDQGNMKVLHPYDSPEEQGPREAYKAKQADVIRRPDHYRAELERMKKEGPTLSDYQKDRHARLGELQRERAEIDPHGGEMSELMEQGHGIYARIMEAKDEETKGQLQRELNKIDVRLEKLFKAQSENLSDQDKAKLKEIDDRIDIVEREQLGGLEGFHEERHKSEINELEKMLRYADAGEHYDAYMGELETLIGKIPNLSYHPFRDSWEIRRDRPDLGDGSRLTDRIRALAELLEGAAETMPDAAERIEKLEAMITPLRLKTRRLKAIDEKTKHADMESDAFTPQRREILRAVMAIISRSIQAPSVMEAQEEFNRQVHLVAHSDYSSDFFAGLYEMGRAGREWSENFDREVHSMEERIGRVSRYLQQFESVARGEVEDKLDEEHLAAIEDFDSRWAEKNWFDTNHLLTTATSYARGLRNEDYMRFHNSFPDAVNFIRSSAESEFLLEWRDVSEPISDAASFFGSAWAHVMGNAEIHVEPELLAKARTALKGQYLSN